jgi:hypothetical protein
VTQRPRRGKEAGSKPASDPSPTIRPTDRRNDAVIQGRRAAAALVRHLKRLRNPSDRRLAITGFQANRPLIMNCLTLLADPLDPDHPKQMGTIPKSKGRGRPVRNDCRDDLIVGWLADVWKMATGRYPGRGTQTEVIRPSKSIGADVGEFARWVIVALAIIHPSHPLLSQHAAAPVHGSLERLRRSNKRSKAGSERPDTELTGLFHEMPAEWGAEPELEIEEWDDPPMPASD